MNSAFVCLDFFFFFTVRIITNLLMLEYKSEDIFMIYYLKGNGGTLEKKIVFIFFYYLCLLATPKCSLSGTKVSNLIHYSNSKYISLISTNSKVFTSFSCCFSLENLN